MKKDVTIGKRRRSANLADPYSSIRLRKSIADRVSQFAQDRGYVISLWAGRVLLAEIEREGQAARKEQ